MEIKQLEEELADDRQNYEDSLIDQQLERLTQQNDDAQTARERQIDLMQNSSTMLQRMEISGTRPMIY